MGAGRIFAVDTEQSRLGMARVLGVEVIDFNQEDPQEPDAPDEKLQSREVHPRPDK